jgi:hypothetical protein
MNKSSIAVASRWFAVSACALVLSQQAAAGNSSQHHESRIKGVWNARVNITNCEPGNVPGKVIFASFDALNIFAADGTFLDTNSQNPALQSEHFGYWRHLRGNKYEFAMKFFMFDAAGASTGWRIVRHELVLSRSGATSTSAGTAESFDNDGVLTSTGCSTSTATRFD